MKKYKDLQIGDCFINSNNDRVTIRRISDNALELVVIKNNRRYTISYSTYNRRCKRGAYHSFISNNYSNINSIYII